MATDGVEDDIDFEAFQAQMDASMAQTSAIVESWVKPTTSRPSAPKLTLAEFEASLRRPPRLGVGASVPEAVAGTSRQETARLRGRLVGSKRGREPEEAHSRPAGALSDDDEEDEGESRASAIKKKTRIDPFVSTKKSKNKNMHDVVPKATSVSTKELNALVNGDKPIGGDGEVAPPQTSDPLAAHLITISTSPSKKKKKKKRKAEVASVASLDTSESVPESLGRFVRAPRSGSSTPEPTLSTPRLSTPLDGASHPSPSPTPVPTSPRPSTDSAVGSPILQHRVSMSEAISPSRATSSILNLDGPPPDALGGSAAAKRRKRKKKKNKQKDGSP